MNDFQQGEEVWIRADSQYVSQVEGFLIRKALKQPLIIHYPRAHQDPNLVIIKDKAGQVLCVPKSELEHKINDWQNHFESIFNNV